MEQIPLAQPDISSLERSYVARVLQTPQLSLGPKVPEFERAVAVATGAKHVVAVNSGTSALHLIVRSLGLGEGDEVITSPFSFIASSNCLLFERVKPVFVDVDPRTGNIDPARIEAAITPRTKALLVVDVFGHPADYDAITPIAAKHNLAIIEDSCEALGARYNGKAAGTMGVAGCFAFYPNKQITTGEGGVVVTESDTIADLCRSMRNQGRATNGNAWLAHVRLGYNYRLSDIHAALGLAQMERLEKLLAARAKVAAGYAKRLSGLAASHGVELPAALPDVTISWFVYVIRLRLGTTYEQRDRVMALLREKGVCCNNYFSPIHLQPFYRELLGHKEGDFPVTESLGARGIALPFFNKLTAVQIGQVAEALVSSISAVGC
ncbi:MAG: DegT/DnrJ/EryC1/StrS family aminotransferase [Phycisphaerae bacterium]|nr:DegT/DnrJ/EryC1/StrS family aminotransferase [Phycisphaerae bacterium]